MNECERHFFFAFLIINRYVNYFLQSFLFQRICGQFGISCRVTVLQHSAISHLLQPQCTTANFAYWFDDVLDDKQKQKLHTLEVR